MRAWGGRSERLLPTQLTAAQQRGSYAVTLARRSSRLESRDEPTSVDLFKVYLDNRSGICRSAVAHRHGLIDEDHDFCTFGRRGHRRPGGHGGFGGYSLLLRTRYHDVMYE